MSIKYYQLAKDEDPPEEFCAVRDMGGEPGEYVYYVPDADNAKLRKLARMMWLACKSNGIVGGIYAYPNRNSNADEQIRFEPLLRELGIEVD